LIAPTADTAADEADEERNSSPGHVAAWLAGMIALGTLIRIPQLLHGLNEMHAFRQIQTTFVALEYARYGINPLHTPLPVFGPKSDVPLEFPLVQAMGALLIRLGVGPDFAMRILGLTAFQAAAILLSVLVLRWHGRLAAIVVVALFEFSPFGLAWGAAALIDFPAVALSLGMVVGLDAWFRTGSRTGLVLGAMSGWLAFLVKATTPPAWCVLVVVSAATAYLTARSWSRIIAGFVAGPILGVAAGLWWTRYADAVKGRNPLTHNLTSAVLKFWNFGTLDERLDPKTYVPVLLRIGAEIAGPLWLGLVFALLGIILAPTKVERIRRAAWLATAAAGPLSFVNLYYVHGYYLIAIFPAIVAAVGIGIVAVAQRMHASSAWVAAAGAALIVVGSAVRQDALWGWVSSPAPNLAGQSPHAPVYPGGLIAVEGCVWDPTTLYFEPGTGLILRDNNIDAWMHGNTSGYHWFNCDLWQWAKSPVPDAGGERVRAGTRPDDLIVVVGCEWDPTTLYFADRRGLMLVDNNLDVWKRENINDYRYLFSCDQSLPVASYLPSGYVVIPTSEPGLWRIASP
jgi:hypothetical protein